MLAIVVQKDLLKHALSRLPVPRNDYEIVVPDNEFNVDSSAADEDFIPDQSDIEANREAELRAKSECTKSYVRISHNAACNVFLLDAYATVRYHVIIHYGIFERVQRKLSALNQLCSHVIFGT